MPTLVEQIEAILKEDDISQLSQDLNNYIHQVALPNEEGEEALSTIFDRYLALVPPKEAMWRAFLIGATWQKGVDEEHADED